MAYKNIHFLYDPNKESSAAFAQTLIGDLGQSAPQAADVIVCIGGDGLMLEALRALSGKPVYSLTPPGSNSRGFWADHGVDSSAKLIARLNDATAVPVSPLEARIRFSNGGTSVIYAFNDVEAKEANGQAILMNLTAEFAKESLGPIRLMGDGFIFSTPLGSTGHAGSYGAPAVDLHSDVIIATPLGLCEPRGVPPIVAKAANTVLKIEFASAAQKRPVRMGYDGLSLAVPAGSTIEGAVIRIAPEKSATLLTSGEPAIKAFSALAR